MVLLAHRSPLFFMVSTPLMREDRCSVRDYPPPDFISSSVRRARQDLEPETTPCGQGVLRDGHVSLSSA